MNQALTIFVAGIGGVFLGMILLYACIRISTLVAGRLEKPLESDEK